MFNLLKKLEKTRWAASCLGVILLGLILATGYRTYSNYSTPSREFDWGGRGMSDFHNGTYYPSLAFRQKVVPYGLDAERQYPLARAAPPYHPFVFIWHQPFTWFDVNVADVLFFFYNLGLVFLLAWMAIRFSGAPFSWCAFFLFSDLLLLSRPGHITIYTGYFTLELVIGTMIAIEFAQKRPWLAGVGILFAAGKPTFVLPLLILLLCRKNVKAVCWGVGLCVALGLAGLGWLASESSLPAVIDGIREGQQALHDDLEEIPINSWTRTDIVGMAAKPFDWRPGDSTYLSAMFLLLLVPGWILWKNANRKSANQTSAAHRSDGHLESLVMVSAMLLSIYHHSYDCLLLFVPWVGVVFYSRGLWLSNFGRHSILVLGGIVWVNYLSTRTVRDRLGWEQTDTIWQIITVINGMCILGVFVVLLTHYVGRQLEAESITDGQLDG